MESFPISNVKSKLRDDARPLFDEFLENQKENPYLSELMHKLAQEQFSIAEAIERGLGLLSKDPQFPDSNLSAYFFLLSELHNIPDRVRDYVLDVSVYCEGASEYSGYFQNFNPEMVYQKEIAPLSN